MKADWGKEVGGVGSVKASPAEEAWRSRVQHKLQTVFEGGEAVYPGILEGLVKHYQPMCDMPHIHIKV